jgi:uncharacterized protein (DUF1501 family)
MGFTDVGGWEIHGTDHGHANYMFVLGGQVKGGCVHGHWPGLAAEQLHEGGI